MNYTGWEMVLRLSKLALVFNNPKGDALSTPTLVAQMHKLLIAADSRISHQSQFDFSFEEKDEL